MGRGNGSLLIGLFQHECLLLRTVGLPQNRLLNPRHFLRLNAEIYYFPLSGFLIYTLSSPLFQDSKTGPPDLDIAMEFA